MMDRMTRKRLSNPQLMPQEPGRKGNREDYADDFVIDSPNNASFFKRKTLKNQQRQAKP